MIKIPGGGKKSELRKIFTKKVYKLIPADDTFNIARCGYAVDISSNTHAVIAFKLNLLQENNEPGGQGYGATRIKIFNSKGASINELELEGQIMGNPVISTDGKYLSLIYSQKPYWMSPNVFDFKIIRLSDNKLIYGEKKLLNDNSGILLDRANNMIVVQLSNQQDGRILCLDFSKNRLYRSEAYEGIEVFQSGLQEFININFRDKPNLKLFFDTDFTIIPL